MPTQRARLSAGRMRTRVRTRVQTRVLTRVRTRVQTRTQTRVQARVRTSGADQRCGQKKRTGLHFWCARP